MKPADTQSKAVALRPAIAREHRDFCRPPSRSWNRRRSPAGRAVAATIILFAVIALGWASFGWIDIITTAQGKVVPTERTKLIQPLRNRRRARNPRGGWAIGKGGTGAYRARPDHQHGGA